MKKGRPSAGTEIKKQIIKVLEDRQVNTNHIRTEILRRYGKKRSWHTVNKYLQILVREGLIWRVRPRSLKKRSRRKTSFTLYYYRV